MRRGRETPQDEGPGGERDGPAKHGKDTERRAQLVREGGRAGDREKSSLCLRIIQVTTLGHLLAMSAMWLQIPTHFLTKEVIFVPSN